MRIKNNHRTKLPHFILFVLSLFIVFPANLPAEQEQAGKNVVEIKSSQITLDVKDADLSELLKKIEKETGVKITTGKELVGKKITVKFADLDVEKALRKILGNNYVFVFYKDPADPKKNILKEVMTVSDNPSLKTKVTVRKFKYGEGKDAIGADEGGEGANMGPSSFAVDDKGNLYICDKVNERVQIFSRDGKYLSTIKLEKGTRADDMVLDQLGSVYIFDGTLRKLFQYNKKGEMVNSIDASIWIGMPMYIADDMIYTDTCTLQNDCGNFPIGRIENGALKGLTGKDFQEPVKKGAYGNSGKRYEATSYLDTGKGVINIIEKDGTVKTITFPVKKRTSITHFLGKDKKGNIYVLAERPEGDTYATEVYKVDPQSYNYSIFLMSDKNAYYETRKEVVIGKDGTIYRFLPGRKKLEIEIVPTE